MPLLKLLYENKQVQLKRLIQIIKKKYGRNINDGGCGVFAKLVHEILGINEFLYIFDGGEPDDFPPIHVMVKMGNNSYTDSSGNIYNKSQIKSIYDYDEIEREEVDVVMFEDDINLLDDFYDELGDGLFCTDYKKDYVEILKLFKNT